MYLHNYIYPLKNNRTKNKEKQNYKGLKERTERESLKIKSSQENDQIIGSFQEQELTYVRSYYAGLLSTSANKRVIAMKLQSEIKYCFFQGYYPMTIKHLIRTPQN